MVSREWILRRNCSITPRQLMMVYAALCTTSLLIAIVFALRGAWYILGFAMLEMLAIGIAFFLYARHAIDREHIALSDGCLLIELIQVEQVRQFRLDPRYTRVEPPEFAGELVSLEARGIKVEVGRYLTEWKRRELARELRSALASEIHTEFQS
ncbi:DUF2244 domain-containing protein [Noviherbaspirillum saxi]|uniref:DUF2244 domain-containing protein n=1 Tax=Noviherbaspirillum saxi TaxID=2320863 RepID=A0A3A3FQY9_9BURK|nr:DUF2244 domain-containing protein [Noviherbaspirillum saxi]RJF97624.1 DUF2244 domain-containing protein [Noviherbaspirillum saxi]